MGNLIKPADYAAKIGISRQAVYAKIKKGLLTSRSIGGKIFIVLDNKSKDAEAQRSDTQGAFGRENSPDKGMQQERLLAAKDETITVLRETITDLKETNKMITSTLRGEVELLKEAFSEMKMLYGLQLEHKPETASAEAAIDVAHDSAESDTQVPEETWMGLSDFYALYGIDKKKQQKRIKEKLKKRLKKGDARVEKINGELCFLSDTAFEDKLAKV